MREIFYCLSTGVERFFGDPSSLSFYKNEGLDTQEGSSLIVALERLLVWQKSPTCKVSALKS